MKAFDVHPHGDGWAVALDGLPLVLRATGRVTPSGGVRATVELWRTDGALLFADEAVLTKEADRERLAAALGRVAGADVNAGPLLALAQAIRTAPQQHREDATPRELQGRPLALADADPWPEPVDGTALLDGLVATFHRFVALPEGAPEALALWVVHTHAVDAADVTPRLALASPTRRCGKSTTLAILGGLVARPLPAANITPAGLFRAVEAYRPTLLIDEADTFLADASELRGLLNAGHYRPSAVVVRPVGDDHEVRAFNVWAPVAVALIGRLPATLEDRSIVIPMRRRRPDEEVEKLRLDRLGELEPLRRMAARWAQDHLEALRGADPAVPPGLHDRAADNWRPLLAIADAAGGEWPQRAREAAWVLSGAGAEEGEGEAGTMILADVKAVFDARGVDRLGTAELLKALHAMEDRPWGEWSKGHPMTPHALARLLKPFGVRPRHDRDWRGYYAADFEEPWRRYLKASQTVTPYGDKAFGESAKRHTGEGCDALEKAENPRGSRVVTLVTLSHPPSREDGWEEGEVA